MAVETRQKFPRPGPGAFQWNWGGWFGSQLGGSLWLLGGALFIRDAPGVTGVWAAAFVAVNVVGTTLWRRRDRIAPFPAILALLIICFVAAAAAIASLCLLDPETAKRMGVDGREWRALLLFPFLVAQFLWLERSTTESRRRQGEPSRG